MTGETNLSQMLKALKPTLNDGDYVFCTMQNLSMIAIEDVILVFKEKEGMTIILSKELADQLRLDYSFIASWITLSVHSSLQAIGLTAVFSKALANEKISCNVVAGYFHDHIFVDKKDADTAIKVLSSLSE